MTNALPETSPEPPAEADGRRAAATWSDALAAEKNAPYFASLRRFVRGRRLAGHDVYPPEQEVFAALALTPLSGVKVVILGQDPYHGPGQAHGLAFSVRPGVPHPPSLRNVFAELRDDLGVPVPRHGSLVRWAEQGVLLLNTVLTVERGSPLSHAGKGWETFTDAVVREVDRRLDGVVFLLWGAPARKKAAGVDTARHHVLTAPHPSPLSASRGFFGCRHFSKANALLAASGRGPVDWSL